MGALFLVNTESFSLTVAPKLLHTTLTMKMDILLMLSTKECHTTSHTTQNQHQLLTTQSLLHTIHLSPPHTTHFLNQHHTIPAPLHITQPHTTQNQLHIIQLLFTTHLQLLTTSKSF